MASQGLVTQSLVAPARLFGTLVLGSTGLQEGSLTPQACHAGEATCALAGQQLRLGLAFQTCPQVPGRVCEVGPDAPDQLIRDMNTTEELNTATGDQSLWTDW